MEAAYILGSFPVDATSSRKSARREAKLGRFKPQCPILSLRTSLKKTRNCWCRPPKISGTPRAVLFGWYQFRVERRGEWKELWVVLVAGSRDQWQVLFQQGQG